jgi:hypothetical protein
VFWRSWSMTQEDPGQDRQVCDQAQPGPRSAPGFHRGEAEKLASGWQNSLQDSQPPPVSHASKNFAADSLIALMRNSSLDGLTGDCRWTGNSAGAGTESQVRVA